MNIMRIQNRDILTDDIFEIVLEHFPDIVHSVDREGRIVFTNRKAEALLGYSREELLSMNIRDLYASEVLDELETGFRHLQEEGEKAVESVLVDKEGTRIPVEIRSFGIYDNGGNFIRTFSILRDIRQVKELQQSLIHAERLAAIGQMATGIVHDINNPLNVIGMCHQICTGLLQEEKPLDRKQWDDLAAYNRDIGRAVESIEKLVTHLRNFSRGMAEAPEVIDLEKSISDALFLVSSKVTGSKVNVQHAIEKGRHYSRASANQMEQVFANLISNACDAMRTSEERNLRISIAPCVRDSAFYWKCSVSDTGCGIPQDLQQDVFRSFFTTKPKGEGTGLGLSMVRGIVKEYRGEVEVMSEPGQGTTFSVYLLQADLNDLSLNHPAFLMAAGQ